MLATYIAEFMLLIGEGNPIPVTVSFSERLPQASWIGMCIDEGDVKRVVLHTSWYRSASERCKRALVFHELGHCVLNLEHRDAGMMRAELDCDADLTNELREENICLNQN
jgi:hypothetical protein